MNVFMELKDMILFIFGWFRYVGMGISFFQLKCLVIQITSLRNFSFFTPNLLWHS